MMNELIFLSYIFATSVAALLALRIGKDALIGLICVQAMLVNLFVVKQITLCGFTATASDSLAVGITLALNLLQEYSNIKEAQKTIWISFFCSLAFIVFSLFHLAYIPSPTDTLSHCFDLILTPMPRVIIASLITFVVVQYIDTYLYAYISGKLPKKLYVIRNYFSATISQFIDTVMFSFLGLYNLSPEFSSLSVIGNIIVVSYAIKLCVIIIAAPFLAASKKLIYE